MIVRTTGESAPQAASPPTPQQDSLLFGAPDTDYTPRFGVVGIYNARQRMQRLSPNSGTVSLISALLVLLIFIVS
jgi:hypothetical protein